MSLVVNVSLAVGNSTYICYLSVLDCKCELSYSCVAVGSNCLLEAVLAVLKVLDLCIVAVNLYRLDAACNSVASVDLNAFKCLALILSCKHECCLAC